MKKIPSLYQRDWDTGLLQLDQVTDGCEWALRGEGVATLKWDGTPVMHTPAGWFHRRTHRGTDHPKGFLLEQHDPRTGKSFGWLPVDGETGERWPDRDRLQEALDALGPPNLPPVAYGTYELCGPGINGNPHGFVDCRLKKHGAAEIALKPATLIPDGLLHVMGSLAHHQGYVEGLVWWHPDGRRAKLKLKDLEAALATTGERY